MSELGQLDTYYRIVYDYLQPDRLLSCVEGVLLSVVGVSGHQDQFPQVNNNDDDDSVADRASSFSSGQLWCVVSTVQSRVLLALILYFCLCLIFIHIAWLVYGQHISDLFVRSGIGQPQQYPQEVNHGGNSVKSSPRHQTKTD